MALSLDQLFTPVDENEALELVLDVFQSLGFTARSWQDGSIPRTIVEYLAKFLADQSVNTNLIAKGVFNDHATGAMLTLFSASQYDNVRDEGVRTQGNVEMSVASGSGPYSKAIGEIIVRDTTNDIRYRNVNAATLTTATSPVSVLFEAELIGADGNQAVEDEVDELVTAMAGVTLTNDASWVTLDGADAESDAELRVRNKNKWATLSTSGPKGAYVVWALDADESVTRVGVDDTNALGTGTVGVYLATDTGPASGAAVTAAQTYINTQLPLTAAATVAAATELDIPVTYVATHDPAILSTPAIAQAAVEAAIVAYFVTIDVGGVYDGSTRVFPLGGIYGAAIAVNGIVNIVLTAPTIDTPMLISQVATTTPTGTSTPLA